MAEISCPYCLADIPKQAVVCRYCGREVQSLIQMKASLLEAKERIAQLEQMLDAATVAVAAPAAGESPRTLMARMFRRDRSAVLVLWSYYLASALATFWMTRMGIQSDYLKWLLAVVVLSVLAGALLTLRDRTTNLGMLFVYGFAQPVLVAFFLGAYQPALFGQFSEMIGMFAVLAVGSGLLVAVGGTILATVQPSLRPSGFYNVKVVPSVVQRSTEGIDRLHKTFLAVASALASVFILLSKLFS